MSNNPRQQAFGEFTHAAEDFTDRIFLNEILGDHQLAARNRSLITITNLVSEYRVNELSFHVKKGIENGLSKEEIIEVITHPALYTGSSAAMIVLNIARNVFKELNI